MTNLLTDNKSSKRSRAVPTVTSTICSAPHKHYTSQQIQISEAHLTHTEETHRSEIVGLIPWFWIRNVELVSKIWHFEVAVLRLFTERHLSI
ncbi:hypothetical protein ACLB2K_060761 [Fragaria x ananassa]